MIWLILISFSNSDSIWLILTIFDSFWYLLANSDSIWLNLTHSHLSVFWPFLFERRIMKSTLKAPTFFPVECRLQCFVRRSFNVWDKRLKDGRMSTNNALVMQHDAAQGVLFCLARNDKYKCLLHIHSVLKVRI